MTHRVRDVLLVSSDYDAFVMEQDGRLRDRLFVEYSELNLVTMPNLVHVSTSAQALEILQQRRFDLVLTTLRAEDPGVGRLSAQLKERFPDLPTVLLALDEVELRRLRSQPHSDSLDRVFLWTGDTRILLAIIKLVEDALNVDQDTAHTGVQVIIVVEDSIRYYSSFLALLYAELMQQSQSLISEGLNSLHKLLRMRARPKILLATTLEEAEGLYQRFHKHVLAVISDMQFPAGGRLDPEAGVRLLQLVWAQRPELPVLMLSASPARDLPVEWVDKNSTGVLKSLQKFLKDNLGFGDFIFRLPDYTEVARARDMYELAQVIQSVDERSLAYHASRGHFNVWLRARSMFELADLLAGVQLEDFASLQDLRQYLLDSIQSAAEREQIGVVTEFQQRHTGTNPTFVRLGHGSLGGKGRGVAFLHALLSRSGLDRAFPELPIRIPRTVALATDCFDQFIETMQGQAHEEACLSHPLPETLSQPLQQLLEVFSGPLAVRSSSLLEDSQHQSCAGVYATVLVPNRDATPEGRLQQLVDAIRRVYASTYSQRAQDYLRATPFSVEDEKMGILIQQLVGRGYGSRFYPDASGVALSWNHYPMGSQRPEHGVAALALGLGNLIVEGGRCLRFAPGCPDILPYSSDLRQFMAHSQSQFYALDLDSGGLISCTLGAAEQDGSLARVASVYVADDDQLRDDLSRPGPRLVSFRNFLQWRALPLAPALQALLERAQAGMGCPVELEFALDLGSSPCLYVLQVRPLGEVVPDFEVELPEPSWGRMLARSPRSLGHGVMDTIRDVIWVLPTDPDHRLTPQIAREVADMNRQLQGQPYLLVGPGRWGSSDPSLGIPVHAADIQGAVAILELPFSHRYVEPSAGSHFFHDLVTRRVGYLCFPPGPDSFVDREWFLGQAAHRQSDHVRWLHLQSGLTLYLDGTRGRARLFGQPAPAIFL